MIDFGFYEAEFFGSLIPEDEFDYYARRALDRIRAYTMNRADEDCDETGFAVCAMAEILYETEGRSGLSSESVDGYSADYDDISAVLYSTAQTYIPASLFYRGVLS